MKKILLAVAFFVVAAQAFAQEPAQVQYEVTLQNVPASVASVGDLKSFTVTTLVGIEGRSGRLTQVPNANEVNTKNGKVENVVAFADTGASFWIKPVSVDQDGSVSTSLRFVVLENDVVLAKGTHEMTIKRGESVVLPCAGGMQMVLKRRS